MNKRVARVVYSKIYTSIFILLSGYAFNMQVAQADSLEILDNKNYTNIKKTINDLPSNPLNNTPEQDNIALEGNKLDAQENNFTNIVGDDKNPAKIWWKNKYIQANDINYNFVEDTVKAKENVVLKNEQAIIHAPKAEYTFDAERGNVENAQYNFIQNDGRGKADKINLERHSINLKNGTYTTCDADSTDWYIKSNEFNIDDRNNLATAKNAKLIFLGVPIFATPYISFSLNKKISSSGFLVPSFGVNSRSGVDISVPYYFSISPQHDATIYPRLIAKRGFLFGGEFRYLRQNYSGKIEGEYLANDKKTNTKRWAISVEHNHKINNWLSAYTNFEKVSDKSYPDDFGKNLSQYSKHLYVQEFGLSANKKDDKQSIDAILKYKNYQSLVDVAPYTLAPQANLIYKRKFAKNIELSNEADASYFTHNDKINKINAKRVFNDINFSKELEDTFYSIKPNIRLFASSYSLDDTNNIMNKKNVTNIIPTFSIDSKLFLERNIKLGEGKQTLEPRLFYVYTPYKNQDNLPLLDTAEPEFGLNALFSDNRFIGHDRIGDANQLTAGLTSRWLDNEGQEKTLLTIGQRYQFNDTKVNIGNKSLKGLSDVIVQGIWRPKPQIFTAGDIQYNPHDNKLTKLSTQIDWTPNSSQMIGVNYKYRQKTDATNNTPFKQVAFNSKWQLNTNWKINSQVSYDLQGKSLSNAFLGFDYLHNCWKLRLGVDRVVGSDGKYTTRSVFQIALKGLGSSFD